MLSDPLLCLSLGLPDPSPAPAPAPPRAVTPSCGAPRSADGSARALQDVDSTDPSEPGKEGNGGKSGAQILGRGLANNSFSDNDLLSALFAADPADRLHHPGVAALAHQMLATCIPGHADTAPSLGSGKSSLDSRSITSSGSAGCQVALRQDSFASRVQVASEPPPVASFQAPQDLPASHLLPSLSLLLQEQQKRQLEEQGRLQLALIQQQQMARGQQSKHRQGLVEAWAKLRGVEVKAAMDGTLPSELLSAAGVVALGNITTASQQPVPAPDTQAALLRLLPNARNLDAQNVRLADQGDNEARNVEPVLQPQGGEGGSKETSDGVSCGQRPGTSSGNKREHSCRYCGCQGDLLCDPRNNIR